MARLEKITFAEMRESGARDVLIYCTDYGFSHHIRISADRWPDDLRVSDIEDRSARCRRQAGPSACADGQRLIQRLELCGNCAKCGKPARPLYALRAVSPVD